MSSKRPRVRDSVERACLVCARLFMARLDNVRRGWGTTCSIQCKCELAARGGRAVTDSSRKPDTGLIDRRIALAHRAVRQAKRRGELVRPSSCAACCVESDRIEAHHEDYARPLDVQWLCRTCHRRRHFDIGFVDVMAREYFYG